MRYHIIKDSDGKVVRAGYTELVAGDGEVLQVLMGEPDQATTEKVKSDTTSQVDTLSYPDLVQKVLDMESRLKAKGVI